MPPKLANKSQSRPGTARSAANPVKNSSKSAEGGGGDADRKKTIVEKKERPPLYEPKYRVNLPPRAKKPKVERWPKIQLPPLKLRPWSYEEAGKLKPPPPKPEIKYPAIKRKPWVPPVDIVPSKPKPKIEYPPLVARTKPQKQKKPKPHLKPIRLSQIFYPIPKSHLSKIWNNYRWKGKNFAILSGNFSQASKKFSDISNNRQSASNAAACILHHLHYQPCSKWSSIDIDKILEIGDLNYRATVSQIRKKIFCPDEMYPIFYVGQQKIEVSVGTKIIADSFDRRDNELIKRVHENISGMLEKENFCIFTYNCDLTFPIWTDDGAFFIFVPYDTDEDGNMVQKGTGTACVIRSKRLEYLLKYLMLALTPSFAKYKIFSIEVVKVYTIPTKPEIFEVSKKDKIQLKSLTPEMIEPIPKLPSSESIKLPVVKVDFSFHPENLKRLEPAILSRDYKEIDGSYGILRGTNFMKDPCKAAAMSAAALIRLTWSGSMKWLIHTIDDLLDLGEKIFEMNPIKNERVSVSDIKEPIPFREYSYVLKTENVIFGQLISVNPATMDLTLALKEFFLKYDTGVIQGPQIVPIWTESGLFFYFDPKERDMLGQKFTGSYDSTDGFACVLWFNDLEIMAAKYLKNIPEKHHRDLFRIVKVNVVSHSHKSENWFNWEAIGLGAWILRASMSEESNDFMEINRGRQGTIMAITVVAFTKFSNIAKWTAKLLDEVLKAGDEIYTISVVKLKSNGKFVSPLLKIDEIEKKIRVRDKEFIVNVGEPMINGSLFESSNEILNLENALVNFFNFSKAGVLTSCEVSVAIFAQDAAYYIFDPHARDEEGNNLKLRSSKKISSGVACALRFSSIPLMASALLSNFVIKDSPEFSIVPFDVSPKPINAQPDFSYFTPLSMYQYAGILRAKVHEDSEIFWLKSSLKTICNLLMAMAFNEIIPTIYWKESDLEDILSLGHDLLTKVPRNASNKEWLLGNIKIGTNQYKFTEIETECVFELHELTNQEEDLIKTEEITPFKRVSMSDNAFEPTSENAGEENDELEPPVEETEENIDFETNETKEIQSIDQNTTLDLHTQIKQLEEHSKVWVIIKSDLFEIGIWKHKNLYFLFDPKATTNDGFWTPKRKYETKHKVWDNNVTKRTQLLRQNQKNISDDVEIEVHDNNLRMFKPPEPMYSMMLLHKKRAIASSDPLPSFNCKDKSGGASIIVFTKSSLLEQHLKKLIPIEHINDTFTWHQFDLKSELEVNKAVMLPNHECNWHNFTCFKPGRWILRGFTAQKDGNLPFNNNQDAAIAVVSMIFAMSCLPESWTSDMVDVALKYGSKLYAKSLEKIKKTHPTIAKTGRLEPEHFINEFVLSKTLFKVQIELYSENSQSSTSTPEGKAQSPVTSVTNLEECLTQFFNDNEAGILSSRQYSVGVFKSGEHFYMFDSHNIGPDGIQREFGVACITRYTKIEELSKTFQSNVLQCVGLNVFKVYIVKVTPGPFPPNSSSSLAVIESNNFE